MMTDVAGRLAVAVMFFGVIAAHAAESAFPTKPIRIVVPIAPGDSTDYLGRLLAQKLGERVPQRR